MGTYLGRFLLPLGLLIACISVWLVATQLGAGPDRATSANSTTEVAAPLASIRRVPEFATQSLQADRLNQALDMLPPEPGGLSCTSVYIDGEPVLQIRSDRALVPSYAQLLITGHAAIDVLGPTFQYETQVLANALPDDNGRIFDGLYLVGGGDPVFMTYNYSLGFRPVLSTRTAAEDLATAVLDAGVVRIDGGVIAIERRYDTQRTLPGWPDQFSADGIVGPLTAIQLDDGFAERAAANLGVAIPSEQPATLAAERFAGLLEDIDIQVFGNHRTLEDQEELPSLVPVGRVRSAPLSDIVFQMLAVNDATAAELLLKEIGVADSAQGTTQAGAQAVQRVLQSQQVEVTLPFRDASGLDPIGGTSCTQLAQAADSIPDDHPTLDVLPSYNLPGVFDGHFGEIEMQSDLRLVGGIEGDAGGLVGRTVDQGRRVTIASVVNRPGGPNAEDLAFQQALVELVDGLRTSISVEILPLSD